MPSTKKTRSYAIALSGILSAICIVLMFCTGFIPIGVYILPAVAGLVVWIIYREISRKWALLCYAAVALLALLLTPDIESKLLFTGFFGYYPVIRDLLTKVKPAVLSFLLRFICFNVPVVAIYALLLNVLGMGVPEPAFLRLRKMAEKKGTQTYTVEILYAYGGTGGWNRLFRASHKNA